MHRFALLVFFVTSIPCFVSTAETRGIVLQSYDPFASAILTQIDKTRRREADTAPREIQTFDPFAEAVEAPPAVPTYDPFITVVRTGEGRGVDPEQLASRTAQWNQCIEGCQAVGTCFQICKQRCHELDPLLLVGTER